MTDDQDETTDPTFDALIDEAQRCQRQAFLEFAVRHEAQVAFQVIAAWAAASWRVVEQTKAFVAELGQAGGDIDALTASVTPTVWVEARRAYETAKLKMAHPENRP